ncbi:MFS transporter [Fluviispira multicolorata]|uniref:MFS transporter n=1 Tax=Fluviispira multicolorata TaxID=2654512 RepID=A0A833N4K7_9BACT|nr:MFS transporter [Fluviispira multicolorata]KAB8028120.1 MFS transporter [Fluviispira multicolorata]
MKNKSFEINPIPIISSKLFSEIASYSAFISFISFIYLTTKDPFYSGGFLCFRILGIFFGCIFISKIYLITQSKNLFFLIDFVRGIIVLSLLFIENDQSKVFVLIFLGFFLGLGSSLYNIAMNVKIPELFESEKVIGINTWFIFVASIGVIIGSLCSGALLAFFDYKFVFLLISFIYFSSAISILFLSDRAPYKINQKIENTQQTYKEFFIKTKNAINKSPLWGILLLITLLDTFGSSAHNIGKPIFANIISPDSAGRMLGFMIAFWAVGKFIGASSVRRFSKYMNQQNLLSFSFFVGVFIMSTFFILAFWQFNLILILIFSLFAGLGDGASEVSTITLAQKESSEIRMTLLSAIMLLQTIGFTIGIAMCVPLLHFLQVKYVVTLFHAFPILAIIFFSLKYYLKIPQKIS